jgi:RNA polymerase sigma-70 factor (ECF subfamily)
MTEHVDKDLIIKCKEGDISAFEQFVQKYQNYVYSVAFRFVADEEEAKDVTQECFIRVWKNIYKYNFSSKITTWMYKIVTNLCIDNMKVQKRKQKVFVYDLDDATPIEGVSGGDMENEFTGKELVKTTEKILNKLPLKQKSVFILRDLEDLNINEVSEILGLSPGSVKSNLYYARLFIRRELEEKFNWST